MNNFKDFTLKTHQTTNNQSENGKFPDFIIVGGQRCGTTSLYKNLILNLDVTPATKKEIHFFDNNYHKGLGWYKNQFIESLCTGEATPYYIFHPHSLRRIANDLPNVKIIVILRNPVDRAYSHYQMVVRNKHETLSFEEAINEEITRLNGELDKMINDENYYSFSHQHFSYLARGIYISQLKNVFRYFKKNQILVVSSENFFNNPFNTIKHVSKFLGISYNYKFPIKIYNKGNNKPMKENTRKKLEKYYSSYNKKLYEYLGENFDWE